MGCSLRNFKYFQYFFQLVLSNLTIRKRHVAGQLIFGSRVLFRCGLCFDSQSQPMAISSEAHLVTRQLFMWLMACMYLFAFVSLYTQVPGEIVYGSQISSHIASTMYWKFGWSGVATPSIPE